MANPVIPKAIIALPLTTVRALATASPARSAAAQIRLLREAGFEGGDEMAAAFAEGVRRDSEEAPEELALDEFNDRVAAFFEQAGWGHLSMSALHDLVAAVDVRDCWEARMHGSSSAPCCHVTTGLLAAFFSSFAPYTLATMEVECAATGTAGSECRFLLGQSDTLSDVYARMERGQGYASALAQLSGVSASA